MRYGHVTGHKRERRLSRICAPEQHARNIARSILEHEYPYTPETWARYGIVHDEVMQSLIMWEIDTLEHPA